ncbi:MAG: oxygen-independent coproporphyrinogen III oxidase [Gammaproteobacteria bacterium]|nr:oxygen-independent coproporphyrinogen III oxidase [Gammaproteobacteria bacterium]MCW8957541.1 oxygen-independent coproporphyrinogen III oxidase [Gammaproteobacteria bacterium]MCW8973735.1 oxygen-independent coproporphyrinogen III oxidase [Gammaproteobacteria bacterium]MCW8993701.1 oxygen-independent coproporphyrinogen III oxidase [Gammaproteobacteria bacterium]
MTTQNIIFDLELIKRYDKSGPRYTSYPTAVQFHEGFGESEYRDWAARSNGTGNPLSLYFHIPFCDTVCYYCGCNKVVTKDRNRASPYLERLHREIALQGALFDKSRTVDQLHWGGGTPTFISHDEMRELMRVTGEHFNLRDDDSGEYSIEIDPREVQSDTIALLRELGFNRMSLGVQDFDERVQKAVNRIQSEASTMAALSAARSEGFKSISIDLIYGLPHQSVVSFARTLDKILEISPDRLSVFNYAHLPELFKPQRRINEADLPAPQEKLDILQNTIEKLTAAGYVYIGMDHFAKPDDELAVAQRSGTLYRNFQGYSTHADCDLVGMGSTSIGQVGDSYSQNLKELEAYYERIDAGSIPVFRGYELNADDKLRRAVITDLICHFELEKAKVEQAWNITFDDYFAEELKELAAMEEDGLLSLSAEQIRVADAGKLLIRNICMVFDRYLREKQNQRFSKVI